MARYFQMLQGLRGCYMPDSNDCFSAGTRRELKAAIAYEADCIRDAEFIGITKKDIAWAAARVWRGEGAILPYGRKGSTDRPFSIELERVSRADYLEAIENENY